MRLKRSKFFILFILSLLAICSWELFGQNLKKNVTFPALYYAGVLPVQWSSGFEGQEAAAFRKEVNRSFLEIVQSSQRFQVLNEDLILGLWKSPAGRKELESEHELSAFTSLEVTGRGDQVILTARLLSPNLETKLQESETFAKSWLSQGTKEEFKSKVTDLVFRLYNRLPVDATLTSVSGIYVTLSAGEKQGLKMGQTLDVVSPGIEKIHPANGSWLTFSSARTGKIEVFELKESSSIAKINSQAYEGSIRPGQGVRIPDIASRNRFARLGASNQEDPLLVDAKPPVDSSFQDDKPKSLIAEPSKVEEKPQDQPTQGQKDLVKDPTSETDPAKTTTNEAPATDSFTAKLMPKGSELRTWVGLKMWSISGSSSAKASLPLWILNSGGADIYRKFSETIDYNYGLDLGYGPTQSGSFLSYDVHGGGRWHMYMKDLLPGADDVYFGLLLSMASTSITGETSGGYSLTRMRIVIGVHGWAKPDFIGDKVEWTGELFYPLYSSGQFGVRGSFERIASSSSLAFKLGGYVGERKESDWQYGGAVDYESNRYALSGSKSAAYSSFGLSVLARRSL